MLVLALDTSSASVTAAVHDGERALAEASVVDGMRHGELLAAQVERVLAAARVARTDLSDVVVGVGPGPFTGLRVGVVTARVLGAVLGAPVSGVCSLDVLAAAADADGPLLVATDARRREVYWACYDRERRRIAGPGVAPPAQIATTQAVAGRGAALHPAAFPGAVPPEYPSAAVLAEAFARGAVEVLPPFPLYLRDPDAAVPGARKGVLPR